MELSSIESRVNALTLDSSNARSSPAVSFLGSMDCYYSLSRINPSDENAVKNMQQARLKYVLKQLQEERDDTTFARPCLFCKKFFMGNRSVLLDHLMEQHNFTIGAPDNIVFIHELLDILEQMLKDLLCLYCEKTFRDWMALKEHMRKKQHKFINPKNKSFDRFYVINYLEVGKTWTEVREEEDEFSQGDSDAKEMDLMDCEDENSGYVCLFCSHKQNDVEALFFHMKMIHKFDFVKLQEAHQLNFYQQIKLINYIRKKVFDKMCIACDLQFPFHEDLVGHLSDSGHGASLPDPQHWDQTMYYFSTFENDNLLWALDAEDSQWGPPVCPEDAAGHSIL